MSRASAVALTIDDVGYGGKGVARSDGKAVFVPFTIEGEKVLARVTREKKNFAEADLIEVVAPSPHRVTPECPYFGECGGCSYQHIRYDHQLELKARQVEQTLRRVGRLAAVPMRAIVPSPLPYGYRNRITVHSQDGVTGFYAAGEHRLIDVAQCPIAMPEANAALTRLRAGRVRDGHYTLRAQDGPRVFSQTNDLVGEALATLVAELAATPRALLVDAYCGAGFFSKRLLANFARIIGIDWDRHAIAAARAGATADETYFAGEADVHFRAVIEGASAAHTTVIVDPPATGLSRTVRETLLDFPAATLIYVSCNPATLARDLAELQETFQLRSVTPLDMFPQTAEIEIVAHLEPREPALT